MAPRYTAAIIGCGDIAHAHVDGYRLNPNVDLAAVVDPVEAATRQFQAEYGIPRAYASASELFQDFTPDLVSICVWHPLHPELTIAAARAGASAVICEKPMATSLGAADEMIAACAQHQTKLVVSHQRRFTPGWESAKALITAGEIGPPRTLQGRTADGLLNCGTHVVDGLLFVAGDPEPIWVIGALERSTDRFERATPIEDWAVLLCELAGGAQMLVQSDVHGWGKTPGILLRVEGERGMVEATEAWAAVFNATSNGWERVTDLERVDSIGGQANRRQVSELLHWLEGGPEHRCSARLARRTTEVMMAGYESARSRRMIKLPLEEPGYPLALMIEDGSLVAEEGAPYDIRAYLRRDDVDEPRYAALRARGLRHHQIMRQLATDPYPT
jgi:UDP-N-acetyl-2-amino-2-deoxyglucuronate dehydrogenase